MQLISVVIRLNSYGVTESRYYVTLFGLFSLVCGIMLSFKPVARNSIIALLAAGFAIFSVIPPVDAFTVSRVSQIKRLENMLRNEGILSNGRIIPKADAPVEVRLETTGILNYLEMRNYLQYVNWLPSDFKTREEMKNTFGFEPAYGSNKEDFQYFNANLDMQKPFSISGYDIIINEHSYRGMKETENHTVNFQVRNNEYRLIVERISPQEVTVSIKNVEGMELVSTGLYNFTNSFSGVENTPKESLSPESMTLDVKNNGYRLRIVLQNIDIIYGAGANAGVNYNFFVLFGAPSE